MNPKFAFSLIILSSLLFSLNVSMAKAAAFSQCPTKAYLIQKPATTPLVYGIDLSTGSYSILSSDMGTSNVNGAGFSFHDSYIYGWDYGAGTLAQIDSDYQTLPLSVSGLIGKPFYVGDVSLIENAWYGYRPNYGLYRIDLNDPLGDLVMFKIADSSEMGNPKITDMAFHPSDNYLYAVDNNGYLLKIDSVNGVTEQLTQVLSESELGFNFTFGAQYFDISGNLYISNNGNGFLYRITLNGASSYATFFSYGPSSNSNDGARCALAAIEVGDDVDFGDAPDSYGTSLASSGARHGITNIYLGSLVDAESTSYTYPLSDDASDASDDDDGISFPTGFEIGEAAILSVEVTGSGGYLNGWIDWDLDGEFDNDEQVITGEVATNGYSTYYITVPAWATAGETWARFRISSVQNLGATGGVSDGEVEDYPITITELNVSPRFYPSASEYTTFAYEDLYPELGDFDMNDVLMNVKYTEYVKDDQVIRLKIEGKLAALGASYHNGFAIRLPGVAASMVKGDSVMLIVDGVVQNVDVLEANQTDAVLVVSSDLWSIVQAGEGDCKYFRTEEGCGTSSRPTWSMIVPFSTSVNLSSMAAMPYDPFIFAAPGTYHGEATQSLVGIHPGRKHEVHLKNRANTDRFDDRLFGTFDDDSVIGAEHCFQNINGLPWALEIPIDWKHPKERVTILEAYPQFAGFAQDSSGTTNPSWYLSSNAVSANLYSD